MKDTYLSLRFCLFLTVLPASLSSQKSSSSLLLFSSKSNENATDKTQTPAPFDTYWIKLLLLKHLKVHPVLNSIFVHLSSLSPLLSSSYVMMILKISKIHYIIRSSFPGVSISFIPWSLVLNSDSNSLSLPPKLSLLFDPNLHDIAGDFVAVTSFVSSSGSCLLSCRL